VIILLSQNCPDCSLWSSTLSGGQVFILDLALLSHEERSLRYTQPSLASRGSYSLSRGQVFHLRWSWVDSANHMDTDVPQRHY
jgi:hypothetical protein